MSREHSREEKERKQGTGEEKRKWRKGKDGKRDGKKRRKKTEENKREKNIVFETFFKIWFEE